MSLNIVFGISNPMYFCLSDYASLNDVTRSRSRPWCYVRSGLIVSGSGKVSEASPEVTQVSASIVKVSQGRDTSVRDDLS